MDELFNLIEKIFPVLIFIFWIIISIIAGARKQKKKKLPPPTTRQGSTSTPPSPYQQQPQRQQEPVQTTEGALDEESSKTASAEDLKKKLESIFGELTLESENEPYDEEQQQPTEKKVEKTPEIVAEKAPADYVPTMAEVKYEYRKELLAKRARYDAKELAEAEKIEPVLVLDTSIDEMRKAVVMSEVLAPPLALRD